MPLFELNEAQQWLSKEKLKLDSIDAELAKSAREIIYGKLSVAFDTSGWNNVTNTPSLIRSILSMWYAGKVYQRGYAEESVNDSYGDKLCEDAITLTVALVEGHLTLGDEVPLDQSRSRPGFYPTDASTRHEPRAFEMGQKF